ncbi:MAG: hypothetical protein RSC25_07675 [Christensenella sp.]
MTSRLMRVDKRPYSADTKSAVKKITNAIAGTVTDGDDEQTYAGG